MNETKICSKCNNTKPIEEFVLNKKSGNRLSICCQCNTTRTKQWQKKLSESSDPNDVLNHTFYKILQASHSNAKTNNIPFELSVPFMRELYAKQKGKCYYTGTPMTLRSNGHLDRDPFLISLDRFDSNNGYTTTNTVLCCWGVNALKGWHPETTLYSTLRTLYENCHALGKC